MVLKGYGDMSQRSTGINKYLDYWLFAFHDTNGTEDKWLQGLSEIGMSSHFSRAYGKIKEVN